MKNLIFGLFLLLGQTLYSQTITQAEYFIDTDPGIGNGTALSITPSDPFISDFIISTSGIPAGLHTLHIRVKDNNGYWSHYEQRIFYIDGTIPTGNIIAMEYFIDTDPGFGNGTTIPITPSSNLSVNSLIPISGLSDGLHLLHVRVKDDKGYWSHYEPRLFNVNDHISSNITNLEYFFNIDPGFGNGKPIPFTNGPSVTIDHTISDTLSPGINVLMIRAKDGNGKWSHYESRVVLVDNGLKAADKKIVAAEYWYDTDPGMGSGIPLPVNALSNFWQINDTLHPNLPLGNYTIYVRVKDDQGDWSMYEGRKIKICSEYGPVADFDIQVKRNQVYLINKSEHIKDVNWNYGNGTTELVKYNPVYNYPQTGAYNIRLIASNPCGADTMIQSVVINGVQDHFPKKIGNDGFFLFKVQGYGFNSTTMVKLRSSSQAIIADTVIIKNVTDLEFQVIIQNVNIGLYDLIVETPGVFSDTVFNAIKIEQATPFEPWVEILGSNAVLINRDFTYKVAVGNSSNVSAFAVPLYIYVTPDRQLQPITPLDNDSMLQVVLDSVNVFSMMRDTIYNDSTLVAVIAIPYLGPGEFKTYDFKLKSTSFTSFTITVQSGPQLLNETQLGILGLRSSCNFLPDCMQCMIDLAGLVPGPVGCVAGTFNLGCSVGNFFNGPSSGAAFDIVGNTVSTLLSCSMIGGLTNALETAFDFGNAAAGFSGALQPCDDCIKKPRRKKEYPTVASMDPNIKIGPYDLEAGKYINNTTPLFYSVLFENADTATAPATEVIVIDTMDKNVYDLSTFRFTEYGFSDTSFVVEETGFSFVNDIDLRPAKNTILRVTGNLDTTTGIALWRFASFDPDTMDLVQNYLDGFLDPNTNAPEGEGFVSFYVEQKAGLAHLQQITNKADIYFDANAPIITPVHENIIDSEAPQSNVVALPAIYNDTMMWIKWIGSDAHSGVLDHTIYVSENDSAYKLWTYLIDRDSALFIGKNNVKYKFYSVATDRVGNEEVPPVDPLINPDAVTTVQLPTGIKERTKSEQLWMSQNRPNPFMIDTKVEFYNPKQQQVLLQIFDHSGRLVQTLMDQQLQLGQYNYIYTATALESGIYFLKLSTPEGGITKKMILMR